MNKFKRNITALLVAASVILGVVTPVFAVNSPVSGKSNSNTTVSGTVQADNTVAVNGVTSTTKKATISNTVDGHVVSSIETGTIGKKYDSVTLILNNTTKVKAKIAKSKKAKKTKKVVIKSAAGQKLTASQFDKKAFKGFKGKIVVKKSSMTKKQYNKLVKRLRKGGFKGKIVYKK